jgi:C1A family cysteine protease
MSLEEVFNITSVLVEVATGKRIHVGGCLASEAAPRNTQRYNDGRLARLPSQVDLRPWMTPVEDQSAVNSCAANAVVGIYEFLARRALGQSADISRLFVYWNARRVDNIRGDKGSTMTGNIRALQELGACTEETWPYQPNLVNKEPSAEAFAEAERFRLEEADRVPINLRAMKHCLAEGFPFAFGLVLFKSFDRAGHAGVVPLPGRAETGREAHGCHAMLAVGYSDRDEVFVVRNSWGPRWGDKGYCYIPYAYMTNPDLCADAWTIRSVADLDYSPRDAWQEDEGFEVDYDEDPDAAPAYVFEAKEAIDDAVAAAQAAAAANAIMDLLKPKR